MMKDPLFRRFVVELGATLLLSTAVALAFAGVIVGVVYLLGGHP